MTIAFDLRADAVGSSDGPLRRMGTFCAGPSSGLFDFREDKNASPTEEQESATGTPMRQTAVPFHDDVIDVPVPGGILAVELASGMTAPVLVIHGLISQRRQWNWLRNVRPDLSLIMPDLRGRDG
jgi:hypothetical protein